jgi:hypothetical protein
MEDHRPVASASPHIFRLPVEVFPFIFELATLYLFNEDPFEHSKVPRQFKIHVCSWWKDIVVNHPILWASISYVHNDGLPTSLNWLRLCLRRSGRHDLHLAIDFTIPDLHPFSGLPDRNRNSFLDTMEDDMSIIGSADFLFV